MSTVSLRATAAVSARQRRVAAGHRDAGGFTLIELLVVLVILPFIVGALALAIVAVFSLNGSVTNRVADAADVQVLSNSYENDVHSAAFVTSDVSSSPQCGTGAQLLGAEWGPTQPPGNNSVVYNSVVSYVLMPTKNSSIDQLLRQYCTNGNDATPASTKIVSGDISPSTGPATITDPANAANHACATPGDPTTSWVTSSCVTGVSFSAVETSSKLAYNLVAVPIASASSGQSVTPTSSSNCGFATPTSGTYASSLCFADFTSLVPSQVTASAATNASLPKSNANYVCTKGGQYFSSQIDNTPFALDFCLQVTGGTSNNLDSAINTLTPDECQPTPPYAAVCAAYMPTYYSPDGYSSEAFLGNNGFYTGVSGRPALYETQNASTTDLFFYLISVVNSIGVPATGWQLATGDAESTDTNEYIKWATCPAASGGAFPSSVSCSGVNFQLVPDNPGLTQADDIGNACGYTSGGPANPLFPNTGLTGAGTYNQGVITGTTNYVECQSNIQTNKTGAVILEAPAPTSLSIEMKGAGIQAIFLGLLLQ